MREPLLGCQDGSVLKSWLFTRGVQGSILTGAEQDRSSGVWPDGNLSGESGDSCNPSFWAQPFDQGWGKNYGIAKR